MCFKIVSVFLVTIYKHLIGWAEAGRGWDIHIVQKQNLICTIEKHSLMEKKMKTSWDVLFYILNRGNVKE